MSTIPHPSLAAYQAHELIEAKKAGRSFQRQQLEDFLAVLIEHWNQNTPQPAIPATPSPEVSPAEAIYAAYPRRIGKTAALKAIAAVLKKPPHPANHPAVILEATKQFASAVSTWPAKDHQFIPHPATWFNRGSYLDDPKEWQRVKPAAVANETRDYTRL